MLGALDTMKTRLKSAAYWIFVTSLKRIGEARTLSIKSSVVVDSPGTFEAVGYRTGPETCADIAHRIPITMQDKVVDGMTTHHMPTCLWMFVVLELCYLQIRWTEFKVRRL